MVLTIIATIMNAMTVATMVAVFVYECGALSKLLLGKMSRFRSKGIQDGNSHLDQ